MIPSYHSSGIISWPSTLHKKLYKRTFFESGVRNLAGSDRQQRSAKKVEHDRTTIKEKAALGTIKELSRKMLPRLDYSSIDVLNEFGRCSADVGEAVYAATKTRCKDKEVPSSESLKVPKEG